MFNFADNEGASCLSALISQTGLRWSCHPLRSSSFNCGLRPTPQQVMLASRVTSISV